MLHQGLNPHCTIYPRDGRFMLGATERGYPLLVGWVTDPSLPAIHCTTVRWPSPCRGVERVVPLLALPYQIRYFGPGCLSYGGLGQP